MIHTLAAKAANCNTGTWQQRWNCGLHQPNPATARVGYDLGRNIVPVLVVLAVVVFLVRAVKRRKKGRSTAPAGAGR